MIGQRKGNLSIKRRDQKVYREKIGFEGVCLSDRFV